MKKEKSSIEKSLLEQRIVFVSGEVNTKMVRMVIKKLLFLDYQNNNEIKVIVDSPGGSCDAGNFLYSSLKSLNSPLKMICGGNAASMGSIIMCAAKKENRFILPTGKFLLHQPLVGHTGNGITDYVSNLKLHADSMAKTKNVLYKILSDATGKTMAEIEKVCLRDCWMDAQESVDFGLVSKIITKF